MGAIFSGFLCDRHRRARLRGARREQTSEKHGAQYPRGRYVLLVKVTRVLAPHTNRHLP
ncbi:hypothetical protein AA103196_0017 [Ameyamaea chiangmaiensis NBRC 103196]|nr:hypothetical protein AA103196_0017 [Ameyamaea chiangmaiensis NBRC 103196]